MVKEGLPPRVDVTRTVKLLNKMNGRDKVSKLIQYGSKLTSFLLLEYFGNKDYGTRFKNLSSKSSLSRKLFRMGKAINEYEKVMKFLAKDGMDPNQKAIAIGSRSFMGLYWCMDNMVFLSKVGFLKTPAKTIQVPTYRAWFWGVWLGWVYIILALKEITEEIRSAEHSGCSSSKLKKLKQKQFILKVKLVGQTCDLIVVSNNNNFFNPVFGKLNDGIIGVVGLISGCCTLYREFD